MSAPIRKAPHRFARRAQWPALFVLSLLEVAWLGSLAYVIHRFVLGPIFG